MPYIGNQPGTGVRNRFIYTATASQTTFSGADDNGKTLKYADSDFVDVFLNGICLVPVTDYTSTSKTSIVLVQAASLNDTLEVVAYDIATISDTVSKADGGTFEANVTFADGADIITGSKGTDNVRLGENAGAAIASGGTNNTLIGKDAGAAITTGVSNTAIGALALDANTTASNNTAVGNNALTANTTGATNTALGSRALTANTTADYGTAVGYEALASNTTGAANTAVGFECFEAVTTGTRNTGVGMQTGHDQTTGGYNTYVGTFAGEYQTTGNYNTAIGDAAGSSMTTGDSNTFLGQQAGNAISTGASNTIIGRYTGNSNGLDIRTSSNNVLLAGGDGKPRFWDNGSITSFAGSIETSGSFATTTPRFYVYGTTNPTFNQSNYIWHSAGDGNANFYMARSTGSGTGSLFYFGYDASNTGSISTTSSNVTYNTSSDYRLKENVVNLTGATERLKQLQPKRFSWIVDELDSADTDGFLAHEVQDIVPNAVQGEKDGMTTDPDGNEVMAVQQIDHSKLVPLLTAALQEAIAKIETLETKVAALEAE